MNPIVDAVLGFAAGPLDKILGRFFPNADDRQKARLEIEAELVRTANQASLAQLEINKAEAQHASLFVAGWRPYIGWACGFGISWKWVLQPMLMWVLSVVAMYTGHELPALPTLDTTEMVPLILGMLGLGGLRTFEKIRGEVDRSTLREP
jgi:hypothetical protein